MADARTEISWQPSIRKSDGPLYIAIADAIAADISEGRLSEGMRLPPQRALAGALGIDFTTVSRAYNEARHRGLVEGRVGQGTYVRARRPRAARLTTGGIVDMSMNLPPLINDPALAAKLWDDMAALQSDHGLELLMRYQAPGGSMHNRAAGVEWLKPRLGHLPLERVVVCAGAQGALLAIASSLAKAGETICAEAITYPGLRALAAHLGIRLQGIAMDGEGPIPEAFEELCTRETPKALYCNPTLHNPTTTTLSIERRHAIVAIARRHGVPIIEDDAYGALPKLAPPPLAALAPDLVYYVGGLAKCLSPALRIAYLVVPDSRSPVQMEGAIRATVGMASPLAAAVAARWIEDGTADAVLAEIRRETAARQQIAAELLATNVARTDPHAFHVWLQLPHPWTRGELNARLQAAGISVVASDAFALGVPPEAVRIGLGAPKTHPDLRRSLLTITDLIGQSPIASSLVV
ncbi:MAG TPA: PLP-dependent aminotransferase family protein [Ensifer sp.]|jgi:DNA-binding transcriptional MocR family regulator|uniref:aminotransferase-like domain-containing protein n=1 Tax=Ensifer sp. TaxID=1872086 RepID=UPI002E128B60|nr:PLP-dependent aminotransferase family protein [Ensifer sp.]